MAVCSLSLLTKACLPQPVPLVHRLYTARSGFSLAATGTGRANSNYREGEAMGSVIEVCALCQGTGWKKVSGNPRVTRCDCRVQARAQRLLQLARIPKRYEHCELSNFEVEGSRRGLAQARLVATRFVEEYPVDNTGLLLIGSVGVGKTHLAVSIIKALIIDKGVPCLFYDYRELLKEIQNSYNNSVQVTELEVLRPVFESEVLALDELGAVKPK